MSAGPLTTWRRNADRLANSSPGPGIDTAEEEPREVQIRAIFGRTGKLPSFAIAALAAVIFVLDANLTQNIAVAFLYVAVVLLTAGSARASTIVLVSIGCAILTVVAFFVSPQGSSFSMAGPWSGPYAGAQRHLVNDGLAIIANAITTLLVLRARSANVQLRERASLLDLSHDTVFTLDMGAVISSWNRAAEELYGWRSEEAVGKVVHDLLETTFPEPIEDIYATLHRTGRWEGELIHKKRDGTQVIAASRWSLHHDRQGQPVAILETNNDITERKRAQESLQQAQSDLARFNRVMLVGEMTASISHEINQPISGAITNANAALHWLATDPPNVEEVRKSLERIVKDGHRASEVIGRVRDLARKSPPRKDPLDINEAVGEVLALTERELHSNSVKVSASLSRDLPIIPADRIQIQQVILNLIMNAVEAMSGTNPGQRDLYVSTGTDSSDVFVEVRDSGAGLQAAEQERLFQSFYTTKEGGMGMGLSLSRSILEAHSGQLSAAPNEPNGAVFRFTLPVVSPATADQEASVMAFRAGKD